MNTHTVAIAIAQAYVECRTPLERMGIRRAIEHISHAFQIVNKKFNPDKFEKEIREITISLS